MGATAKTPYPILNAYPTSGLNTRWADYQPDVTSTSDIHLGPDGVGLGMVLIVYWKDLLAILPFLLGYSYRFPLEQTVGGVAVSALRRVLPWQHPYMNHLFVKSVTKVQGGRMEGKNFGNPVDLVPGPALGGLGAGFTVNSGPWTDFNIAFITLQFWRPPYAVRTDDDIKDSNGVQREWLRYVSRDWEIDSQFLSREGMAYVSASGQNLPAGELFRGAIGQQVFKTRISRRWYQIPEAALFPPAQDTTRQGIPYNQVYTRTTTTNPITAYVRTGGAANPVDPTILTGGASGPPICGCVNSPIGGGVDDSDATKRLFGCPMGTLAYLHAEFHTAPLQLPPYLMAIPGFGQNEALSQVQYDVTHHFVLFDPERAPFVSTNNGAMPSGSGAKVKEACRGHNLFPWAGDGLFYAWQSQNSVSGAAQPTTAFQYADLSDLYQIL